MPPSGHSSSSHSSSSHHSSSHSHSSSSHSSSSHSSSSGVSRHSSSYLNSFSKFVPKNVPKEIRHTSLYLRGKRHFYVYYSEDWYDNSTGNSYYKGYYDENGQYYKPNELKLKHLGSTKIKYRCAYCGTENEYNVKDEMQAPKCQNCGAIMEQNTNYADEILEYDTIADVKAFKEGPNIIFKIISRLFLIQALLSCFVVLFAFLRFSIAISDENNYSERINTIDSISNIDIYGTDLYLDNIGNDTYVICQEVDDWDKHLTWDYGVDSYYDRESDCYIWYNTDVAPNLWQYWYEGPSTAFGDYGWMEYENGIWYVEVADGDWQEYNYIIPNAWHIQNNN